MNLKPYFFQHLHNLFHVFDHVDGQFKDGAHCRAQHLFVREIDGALKTEHGLSAAGQGRTDDGAKIAWILHAIDNDNGIHHWPELLAPVWEGDDGGDVLGIDGRHGILEDLWINEKSRTVIACEQLLIFFLGAFGDQNNMHHCAAFERFFDKTTPFCNKLLEGETIFALFKGAHAFDPLVFI